MVTEQETADKESIAAAIKTRSEKMKLLASELFQERTAVRKEQKLSQISELSTELQSLQVALLKI